MPTDNHLLSVATDATAEQIFIHADAAGLDLLIHSLTRLRTKLAEGTSDHDHFMSEAWSGHELTTPLLAAGERAVQHIKLWLGRPRRSPSTTPDLTTRSSERRLAMTLSPLVKLDLASLRR